MSRKRLEKLYFIYILIKINYLILIFRDSSKLMYKKNLKAGKKNKMNMYSVLMVITILLSGYVVEGIALNGFIHTFRA